uniref:Pancreatic progenitor cell differentiation and proliferation factor-like n=1 Tax=Camelus bactrianus TaxID=9837 RepID=A0A9W3FHN8_CAMBA|nr:pancreatic progenitor cell differentiation and proliferation factor-like [Camelus bactrianus]
MAAIPSSGSLMATHDYRRCLGCTSSNSSCRSAEYPGEAIPHHPASFSGSPLSHSWAQCWSPRSTWNRPRPPAQSPVTWLRKPWGSSSLAASWQNQLQAPVLRGCHRLPGFLPRH